MASASSSVPSLSLNSGYPMPQIGFGTWMCKPSEVNGIVKNAIRNGYRHLDCAFIYQNQEEIGNALKEMIQAGEIKREELFITSKVWNTFHSYDAALANVDTILAQLGIDYLDLCLIHWPIGYREGAELLPKDESGQKVFLSDVDFLETWRALENTVAVGKVRSIGVSNFNSSQIQRIFDNCSIRPCALQTECHPFFQQKKLRAFCQNNGIHFVASCPLASSADNMFRKTEYPKVFEHPTISEIASRLQKSNAQVALRFLTQLGIAVVPRSSDAQRQRQNIDIFGFTLGDEQMAQMEALDTGKRIVYLPIMPKIITYAIGLIPFFLSVIGMPKIITYAIGLIPFFLSVIGHPRQCKSVALGELEDKDLVIITDMEPDDRIALALVASQLAKRVLAIGTTVLHAQRKAELARHALLGTALEGAKVFAGTGLMPDEYPKMFKSTEPGRTYGDREGKDILDEQLLEEFKKKESRSRVTAHGNEFQNELKTLLARNDGRKIHFLVLAPPTDLTAVLSDNRDLAKAIGQIHLMGGWDKPKDTESTVLRSSYNVDMDGNATAKLLQMASDGLLQVTLYSAHVIAKQFNMGSINRKHFEKLIDLIIESKAPCMEAFRTAGKNWDSNLVKHYEKLKEIVGPYIGQQFTPADPLTVIGFLEPKLIKSTEKVRVKVIVPATDEQPEGHNEAQRAIIRPEELPTEDGYAVLTEKDDTSGISLITEFDVEIFKKEMERIFVEINNYEAERHSKASKTAIGEQSMKEMD